MTKVSTLRQEGKFSYGIKVENDGTNRRKWHDFVIPVIDVRDGEVAREKIKNTVNSHNTRSGSKFMKPSFSVMGNCYQNSFKKNGI